MDIKKVTNDWNNADQFLDEKINAAKAGYNPLIAVIANSLDAYGVTLPKGQKNILDDNGAYNKTVASINLSDLGWSYNGTNACWYSDKFGIKQSGDYGDGNFIMTPSRYKFHGVTSAALVNGDCMVNDTRFYIKDTAYNNTTKDQFIESLNGVILYYELGAPTSKKVKLTEAGKIEYKKVTRNVTTTASGNIPDYVDAKIIVSPSASNGSNFYRVIPYKFTDDKWNFTIISNNGGELAAVKNTNIVLTYYMM